MRAEYKRVLTDGSGKMKVARGKVHKYLGVTIDFTTKGAVKISMIEFNDEIIQAWDDAFKEFNDRYKTVSYRNKIHTAAPMTYSKSMLMKLSYPNLRRRHSTTL